MNTDSINKVALIGLNLIAADCQSPYLTSPASVANPANTITRNLPELLKTLDSTVFSSGTNITTLGNIYYKSGVRENPNFTSNTTVYTDYSSLYKWTTNAGWTVNTSTSTTAFNAFTKDDTASVWTSTNSPTSSNPEWISIKYPTPVLLKYFSIQCGTLITQAPKSFKIFGSINGTAFLTDPIQSYENITWAAVAEIKNFYISDLNIRDDYKAFKIVVSETQGGGVVTIAELKLFTKHDDAASWSTTLIPSAETINFTARLTSLSNPILAILDRLRICYNLLDDINNDKLTAYNSPGGVTVNTYSMLTMGTYTQTIIRSTDTSNAIKDIFGTGNLNPAKTNFSAVKRLLKAYEYIIHVYIAMTIEDDPTTPNTDLILNQLNNENNSLNDNVNGYRLIQNRIKTTTNNYNDGLDKIDKLDIQLEDLKEDVVKEKTSKDTNSNILNKNTIVYYVFLLLFILLACVLLYSFQKQDDEKSKIYVGGVLATSIVAMIIIYFLNMTYLKEGFTSDTNTQTNLENYINVYLSDTVNISLMTDHYTRYKDVLRVVNKEIDRYDGINKQLKLEATGTNDIHVYDYRNARVLQYRVYLLLQIMIILSIAMFIYLYTGENILLFGIVLLLVLFAIYIYIMNTHSMVHTDAKKIYWGQPSIS